MSDTVEIIIKAKDQASGPIGDVSRALGGIRSAAGRVGAVAGAAFVGVGAAAVGGFGLALRESINMNASLEQSTMMFTTLMGDAELAERHVASLFQFAADTPFETAEIIQASKHFQVFGGRALNTLENLTLVGDAAAAVGAPFDEVAFWVGRAYSAIQGGQPFGEAAMRLQELGLMSPDVRTAMEEMQKSGADADEVWGAFAGNMGNFTGAMQLQAGSWVGLTSTIKDNVQMMMATALKPFFELMKQGLSGLVEWLSSPEIQAGIQNLANGFQTLVTSISTFVTQHVIPFVQEHGEALKGLLIGLAAAFTGLLVIGAVGAAIALITNPITWVIAALGLLVAAWTQNWGGIQEKTAAVVEFIKGAIQAGLEFIQGLWATHGGTIMNIVTTVMTTIQTIVGAALAGIQQFWQEHGAAIMAVVQAAWDFIKVFIQTAVALIVGTAQSGLDTVREFWDAHGKAIMSAAQTAWEFISRIIEGVLEHVRLVFEMWKAAMEGDFDTMRQKLVEIWQNLWDTVLDILRGLWALVAPVLSSFWNSITGWFAQKRAEMSAFGQNLINGLIAGINAVGMNILAVLGDWVQAAIDYAKSLLGISSPSRVFFEVGIAIGEGLIAGIDAMEGEVLDKLGKLMDSISKVGGLGGNFSKLFEARNITPLELRAESLRGELGHVTTALDEILKEYGLSSTSPALREILLGQMGASPLAGNESELRRALTYLDARESLLKRQKQIEDDLIRNQNELLRLEAARANFGFLQQQFELLKMVRDNNLGAEILEGLQLGIGADPGALMQAMVRAMEAMIRAAENELGIASPSKWAQRTMENVMGTMADTVRRGSPAVADGLALTPARSLPEQFFGRVGNTTTINIDARGAERGAAGDIRRVVEQVLREQGTRADIRMRTT